MCTENPGKEVDVFFTVDLRTMVEVWMGDISYKSAIASGRLAINGETSLTRHVTSWLTPSMYAGIRPASEI